MGSPFIGTPLSPMSTSATPTPFERAPMERTRSVIAGSPFVGTPLSPMAATPNPFGDRPPMERTRSSRTIINQTTFGNQRTIRVFLSSAYGAMESERQLFHEQHLPLLEALCELLAVTLVIVDLRWDISEETKRNEKVLVTTLNALSLCDVFIGFYGQRYGWHDKGQDEEGIRDDGDDLLALNFNFAQSHGHSWIGQFCDRSVVELEYLAFAQYNTRAGPQLFLWREKAYDDQHCEEATDEHEKKKFRLESAYAAEKREEFQRRVSAAADLDCFIEYAEPKEAAQKAYEFLRNIIKRRFGEEPVGELMKTRCQHEAFLSSRVAFYRPNEELLQKLKWHVETDCTSGSATSPIVLIGQRGTGKTSFIANWISVYQRKHPEDLVLFHFIGASAESAEPFRLMSRVLMELRDMLNIDFAIPQDLSDMSTALLGILSIAAKQRKRIVLVIDALDQLQSDDGGSNTDLRWLPVRFPPRVSVVLSGTNDPWLLDYVERYHWSTMEVRNFDTSEETELVNKLIYSRGRRLTEQQIQQIVNAPKCANPLYLCTLLDELCTQNVFENLDALLPVYLQTTSVEELFHQILARIEAETTPDTVAQVVSVLFCSRYGLSEPEILDILEMEQTVFSPIYFQLRRYLVNRAGLLVLYHHLFAIAVEQRYVNTPELFRAYHRKIAAHFSRLLDAHKLTTRVEQELGYHLEKADNRDDLRKMLLNTDMFGALQRDSNNELLHMWKFVGDSPSQIAECFLSATAEKSCTNYALLAALMEDLGDYDQSLALYKRALQTGSGDESLDMVNAFNRMGAEYLKQGRRTTSIKFHQRSLRLLEDRHGADSELLVPTLSMLAAALYAKERYDEALVQLQHALRIRSPGKVNHGQQADLLIQMAAVYQGQNKLDETLKTYQAALMHREKAVGTRHPAFAAVLRSMGEVQTKLAKYQDALRFQQRALHIYEGVFGRDSVEAAEQSLVVADLFVLIGNDLGACQYLQRAVETLEARSGHDSLAVAKAIGQLASVEVRMGQKDEAWLHLKSCSEIYSKLYGPTSDENQHALAMMNVVAAQF